MSTRYAESGCDRQSGWVYRDDRPCQSAEQRTVETKSVMGPLRTKPDFGHFGLTSFSKWCPWRNQSRQAVYFEEGSSPLDVWRKVRRKKTKIDQEGW
jgi:hypothetical protein